MLLVNYKINPSAELCEAESEPNIMFYICDSNSSTYSDIIHHMLHKDMPTETNLSMNIQNKQKCSRSLCLCADLYVKMNNRNQVKCNTRIAGVTVNIHDLIENPEQSTFNMINFYTGEIKTSINLKVTGTNKLKFMPVSNNDINTKNIPELQANIDNYVKLQMEPFLNKGIKPSDSFLYHVHAPFYNTRVMRLPGSAYYILPDRIIQTAKEDWCSNWVNISLCRHNMTSDLFNETISKQFNKGFSVENECMFKKCLSVIGEAATILVHSYTYKSDFVYTNSGKKTSIESFDNIFITGAGDCEDSSKGIYTVLSIFSKASFNTLLMKNVQKVCQLYFPFGVLGEVNNPSIHTVSSSNNLAHMFTIMLPKTMFYQNKGSNYSAIHNFEHNLPVLLLEGTGRVKCLVASQLNNVLNNSLCIPNTEQYISINKNMSNVFYKKIVHLYGVTDLKNKLSYSVVNSDNEYGVDFFDFFNGQFKILDHVEYDDNLMEICKNVVNIDTPILFNNPPDKKETFISSKLNSYNDDNINTNFTDIYTHGKCIEMVLKQLSSRALKFKSVLEFTDCIDKHYRIRVYE